MTDIQSAAAAFARICGTENVRTSEPMRLHTTFKVGGPADIYITPGDDSQISAVFRFAGETGLPCLVMGNGSNLVVSDAGIPGAVISLFERFNSFRVDADSCLITAEAGALLSRLARAALDAGLTGLEFAAGIPGTLGGAVAMNAGAYDGEMRDVIESTDYILPGEAVGTAAGMHTIDAAGHGFGYRSSIFQTNGAIVLRSTMRLRPGDKAAIKARMDDLTERRRSKQPLEWPSAGSVFRRPEGYFTGKLIEDCGLKGYSIGGAQISEKHSGFIINTGTATAADITALVEYVKSTVYNKFKVRLETEIKFVPPEDRG